MRCSKRWLIYALNLVLFLGISYPLTLSREQIGKIAQRELKKLYPQAVLKKVILYSDKIVLPDKPLLFEIGKSGNLFVLKIEDALTGEPIKEIPLKVENLVRVPVAAENIPAGKVISPQEVKWEYRPLNGNRRFVNPIGKVAVTPIRKGEVIEPSDLGVNRVSPGKEVKVIFLKGGLEIETTGTLLVSGKIGQPVKVRKGKKIFEGILKDENTVVVYLP